MTLIVISPSTTVSSSTFNPTVMDDRPSVRLLVQAYTAMLQNRTSQRHNGSLENFKRSHLFYDRSSARNNKSRYRSYRKSPNNKQWLSWDTGQDSRRYLSDPNLSDIDSRSELSHSARTKEELSCLCVDANDDGCHSDFSPSPTWSGVQNITIASGEHSLLSLDSSRMGSVEDLPITLSASCSNLVEHVNRSLSQDSAVEVDLFASITINENNLINQEISRLEYTKQWNKCRSDSAIKKSTTGQCSADRPRIVPPSVVISDHSSDRVCLRVALLNEDFKLSSFSAPPVTEPLSEFGLSVSMICPRKVSECSTCSSVSTVDMSPESHLILEEYIPSRRGSCCSNCSTYTSPDTFEESDPATELLHDDKQEVDETSVSRKQKVCDTLLHKIL